MNPDEAEQAVKAQATLIARYADGSEHGRGRVISYSIVPTFTIESADGTRFSWRHDMVSVAPTWEATQ